MRRVLAAFVVAGLGASDASAQMFRTLFTRGGPDDQVPLRTAVSLEVHPVDGRIRVVDDSARVHVYDAGGRRLEGDRARDGWGGAGAGGAAARGAAQHDRLGPHAIRLAAGTAVVPTADSARVRVVRLAGDSVVHDRAFRLPGDHAMERLLVDGAGRAWFLVCPDAGGCGEQERWIVFEPPPADDPDGAATFTGLVPPRRFRLEAVRGSRLYGVQGVAGRQYIHVLALYEDGGAP